MGDMVIGLVAQKYGKIPAFAVSPSEVLVTVFDSARLAESLRMACGLRAAGLRAEWYPEPARLDKQLKYADANRIGFAVIVGPDETAQGTVTLKDLRARTQEIIVRDQLVAELRRRLRPPGG
jgi:histidyl-tRNA synthetase